MEVGEEEVASDVNVVASLEPLGEGKHQVGQVLAMHIGFGYRLPVRFGVVDIGLGVLNQAMPALRASLGGVERARVPVPDSISLERLDGCLAAAATGAAI